MTLGLILLYLLSCLGFMACLVKPDPRLRLLARLSLLACLAGHLGFEIRLGLELGGLPLATPAQTLSLLVLLALAAATPLLWPAANLGLGAFVLPALTALAAFGLPLALAAPPLKGARYWLALHTLGVLAGEAAWLLAASGALAYLVHERAILRFRFKNIDLPSLKLLDRCVAGLLVAAFAFMSLGLILGGLWAVSAGVALAALWPRILGGGLSWLVLAFSLHQRFALMWRGRRTALIAAIGFFASLGLMGLIYRMLPPLVGAPG